MPLYKFYIKGPKFLGCWENRNEEDICSSLTGNPAEFWKFNENECGNIISNKFESYYILFTIVLYLLFIYKISQIIWWRYFVYRPMINDFAKLIDGIDLKNKILIR